MSAPFQKVTQRLVRAGRVNAGAIKFNSHACRPDDWADAPCESGGEGGIHALKLRQCAVLRLKEKRASYYRVRAGTAGLPHPSDPRTGSIYYADLNPYHQCSTHAASRRSSKST